MTVDQEVKMQHPGIDLAYGLVKHRLVAPENASLALDAETDQDLFRKIVERNNLEALVHTLRMHEDQLPLTAEQQERYRRVAHRRMLFGQHQLRQAMAITEALKAKGIPCVCMRGPFASQDLYGDPGIRPFTDIDLLVPREQAMVAWEVTAGLGYKLYSEGMPLRYFLRHHLHWQIVHPQQNVMCDLHWAVEHPYRLYTIDYDAIFREAVSVESPLGSWLEPAPHHHLLLTALHLRKHRPDLLSLCQDIKGRGSLAMQGEIVHLTDIALLLQRHPDLLADPRLLQEAERWKAVEALAGSVAAVNNAFDLDLSPDWLKKAFAAIPAWQQAPKAGTGAWTHSALSHWMARASRSGGFRPSKFVDAWTYLVPPPSFFGERPGCYRWLRRKRHACWAGGRLAFALLDTAAATITRSLRNRMKRKTVQPGIAT